MSNVELLIKELINNSETDWLEFKHNNYDPDMIGADISALANGATLCDRDTAYFVWGVDDKTHEIIGTDKNLNKLKKGNEDLEAWLRRQLSKNVDFEYENVLVDGKAVGILKIKKAIGEPVKFEKQAYIRVGSYTKKLNDYVGIEARLWNKLNSIKFENQLALGELPMSEVLRMLDSVKYYDLLNRKAPSTNEQVIYDFQEEGIIKKQDNGLYGITNLGAILFSKHIIDFPSVSRKAIRVVKYIGDGRTDLEREITFDKGYALVFEEVLNYIDALLPSREIILDGIRNRKTTYPLLAIREIVANALIHQDYSIGGTGPIVEIFDKRIEITNPGTPLIDIVRIVDNPPRSRNEQLSSLMRRMKMCEELGTGWDRAIAQCEIYKMLAPKITLYPESTKVTMYAETNFSNMTIEDKLWSCYMHACVLYIEGNGLTNMSLRQRFNLNDSSSGSVSRLIKMAVEVDLIKPIDPTTAPRYMKYIPSWA